MLSALDHTTTDTLHNFHDALQHAQHSLTQEEHRLREINNLSLEQHNNNIKQREFIKYQQHERLSALRREVTCSRTRVLKLKEEIKEGRRHMESIRQPREIKETQRQLYNNKIHEQQYKYIETSMQLHVKAIECWQPQWSIIKLKEVKEKREAVVVELQNCVRELMKELSEYTGENNNNNNNVIMTEQEEEEKQQRGIEMDQIQKSNNNIIININNNNNNINNNNNDNNSIATLTKQLHQQQEARALWAQESAEILKQRREIQQKLKSELKQLCANVEAADADQQTAQQEFHAALNQESETRVGCRECKRDIVGSFTL